MGKDTRKMNNIMHAEVQKSIEFSLPQAQVFYISSRNKFILVKTTNLSLSSFMWYCHMSLPIDARCQKVRKTSRKSTMCCLLQQKNYITFG